MTRIFSYLAAFAFVFFCVTLALGFGTLADRTAEALRWRTVHFLSGVAAALVVLLVNGIVVTYLIGTTRWCKEVVETYSLSSDLTRRSTSIKRRTFPWALLSMLAMIAVVATGAASDPANTLVASTQSWKLPHLAAALTATAIMGCSFFAQFTGIRAQHAVITEILAEVRRIRLERGLDGKTKG